MKTLLALLALGAVTVTSTCAQAECVQWGRTLSGDRVCMAQDLVNRNPVIPEPPAALPPPLFTFGQYDGSTSGTITLGGGTTLPQNYRLSIMTSDSENWIELAADGSVTFGPHYNADEVAKVFWRSVGQARVCQCAKDLTEPGR